MHGLAPSTTTKLLLGVALMASCGGGSPAPMAQGEAGSPGSHEETSATGASPEGSGGASNDAETRTSEEPPGDTRDDATNDEGGAGEGLGPADFDEGELDAPSHGGTITFTDIGAPGWYPSRRDPAIGPCDAHESDGCCMAQHVVEDDALTPWDEDLAMTLRGPMAVKQIAVYQPGDDGSEAWRLVSAWDERAPESTRGLAFVGDESEAGFAGAIGTECLVDVTTDTVFPCGDGSTPYCPAEADDRHEGWRGAKLFVLLARMPHADREPAGTPCSEDTSGNWWDAPWIGLSLGELQRAGAFSSCQCYAKNPDEWWLGDGCGQFNVFEVVNDNNEYRNLDVFSTNFFGYAGYVGEGPCGAECDVSALAPEVDLVDKSRNAEAGTGASASPDQGPGAAFRRPAAGYRYFAMLLDPSSRSVQLAIVHPQAIPAALAPLLPNLPGMVPGTAIGALLDLRLPNE